MPEYIHHVRGGFYTPCRTILTPALTTESGEEFYSGCLGIIIKHTEEPQSTPRDYSEVPTAPHTQLRVYISIFLNYAPYRAFSRKLDTYYDVWGLEHATNTSCAQSLRLGSLRSRKDRIMLKVC